MSNEINARIQHAVIGEGDTSTSSVPKKGEIIFSSTLDNFRVGTDGNTPYSSLGDFLYNFTGADTSSDGTSGLVPAPSAGDQTKFLRGDGTWQDASGGGGSYTLPVATSSALGGIKIGYTQNSNNYPVQLGSNTGDTGTDSRAYVNVPWSNTTYKFKLNGTFYGGGDTDLSNGGIYAPIDVGSQYDLLIANNSGIPTWNGFSNAGFFKRTTSGWGIDTNSYSLNDHTHTLSIASAGTSAESNIDLTANTIYTLTAGGSTFNFKTPADSTGGDVDSVQISASSPLSSSNSTAQTGAVSTTISFSNQSVNTVLAGPSSGSAAAPTFRSLVADDIPSLTVSKISDFPSLTTETWRFVTSGGAIVSKTVYIA